MDQNSSEHSDPKSLPSINAAFDALLFDVDGTLLDIASTPETVVVPASLKTSLSVLTEKTGGALALVSGRRVAALDELFAPLRLAAIGCHGAEMRISPDGPDLPRTAPLADDVKQAFADVAAAEPRVRVEDKVYTLAFHYRSAPDREAPLFALLRARIEKFRPKYKLLYGKAIVEVKQAGIDKGEALKDLLGRTPFSNRRPIYFGDDTTDEDAFSILPEFGGLGVSVGKHLPHAQTMVDSPQAVRDWLACLAGNEGNGG